MAMKNVLTPWSPESAFAMASASSLKIIDDAVLNRLWWSGISCNEVDEAWYWSTAAAAADPGDDPGDDDVHVAADWNAFLLLILMVLVAKVRGCTNASAELLQHASANEVRISDNEAVMCSCFERTVLYIVL